MEDKIYNKRFLLLEKNNNLLNAFEYIKKITTVKKVQFIDKDKFIFHVSEQSWKHPVGYVFCKKSSLVNIEEINKIKLNENIRLPDIKDSFCSVEIVFRDVKYMDDMEDDIIFTSIFLIDTKEILDSLICDNFDLKIQKQIDAIDKNLYNLIK